MKLQIVTFYCLVMLLFSCSSFGQSITLLQQFNGRYDFTMIGNTLNPNENNTSEDCYMFTTATADLNLDPNDLVEKAYLYWAGSGTGDFNVKLNGIDIVAQRTFGLMQLNWDIPFFSAFADITNIIQNSGNGTYTFSDIDLNAVILDSDYCANRTNFGGWAMLIVFKNNSLPLNQLNVYDGLQGVPDAINITLNSLNVIDNVGAKIGFIAWEGDNALATESLIFNGNVLSNTQNPEDNAFNGTNSFTGATNLYNMDLDVYDIQNNIQVGDQTAQIQLTSTRDFVMVNTVVTKLNSQVPDAVIAINNVEQSCDSKTIVVDYTVSNLATATNPLPANVPIAIFADGIYIQSTATLAAIPIGGSESNTITIVIPSNVPTTFTLKFVVDSTATASGTVAEINENNNEAALNILLWIAPAINLLGDLIACNEGFGKATFDFSNQEQLVKTNPLDVVTFYHSQNEANAASSPITNITNYTTTTFPAPIFVRIEDNHHCFSTTSFNLKIQNCPPKVYNLVATDADNFYDTFQIDGLRNIFMNFKLSIYNRWGTLVWEGNNSTEDWDGTSTKGTHLLGNELPDGTYYYILELNDPDYPNPLNGFLHLKK